MGLDVGINVLAIGNCSRGDALGRPDGRPNGDCGAHHLTSAISARSYVRSSLGLTRKLRAPSR